MTAKEIADKVLYRGGTYHQIFQAYDPVEYNLLEQGMINNEYELTREFRWRGYTFAKQFDPILREYFYLVIKQGTSNPNERLCRMAGYNEY